MLQLVDLVNPSADTIPKDKPTEWSVFTLGQGGDIGVKDGQDVPSRKWVTYLDTDGVYYVGLWDGEFLCRYGGILRVFTDFLCGRCDATTEDCCEHYACCDEDYWTEVRLPR